VITFRDETTGEQVNFLGTDVTQRPCGGVNALTWQADPSRAPGSGNIIMLCNTPLSSSQITVGGKFTPVNVQTSFTTKTVGNPGIDMFRIVTSKTLLHESMHASNLNNCAFSNVYLLL
jgi:hypothetical protein